jgi:hypothetical protein
MFVALSMFSASYAVDIHNIECVKYLERSKTARVRMLQQGNKSKVGTQYETNI